MTKTLKSDDLEIGVTHQGSETMLIERRELLKMLGVAAGATGLAGCDSRWSVPDRLVDLALRGPGLESEMQTICGLCEGGCGVSVRLVDGLPVGLKGNPHHPLNRGGLCPVGLAGLEILYGPDRLRVPLRRSSEGVLEAASWDGALEEISARLETLYDSGKGAQVAVISGENSQLFHDLAQQFVGSLGSASIARLGKQSTLPFKLMQGIDEIPGYDLARADTVLAFGLEPYEDGPTPMHAISATVGSRSAGERATLIYVGTRMSPSAAKADIRALVRPETIGAFALGVAHVLVREGRYDRQFVANHTFGFDEWEDESGGARQGFRRLLLEHYYPDRAAQLCGCKPELIVRVARRFAAAEMPIAISGGATGQSSNATFTTMAVHALNALVGNFDKPGGVTLPPPVPLTPMPRLDRDSGSEANSVFSIGGAEDAFEADPVDAFAEAVLSGDHVPEVLLLVGSNPVHSSPAGSRFQQAMGKVPTVVALAPFLDDTAAYADFVLPTPTFFESWHSTTTPVGIDFSTLGIGKPVVEPLYDTRHAADVLLELGRRTAPAVSASLPWADYPAYLK
jgi:anaerobic selenocysteine-containing dehydrogenase